MYYTQSMPQAKCLTGLTASTIETAHPFFRKHQLCKLLYVMFLTDLSMHTGTAYIEVYSQGSEIHFHAYHGSRWI